MNGLKSRWNTLVWCFVAVLCCWTVVATTSQAKAPPASTESAPVSAKASDTKAKSSKTPTQENKEKPAAKDSKKEPAKKPAAQGSSKKKKKKLSSSTGRRESEVYGARLENLQTEVNALKDRIFRSKARLSLLKETVLHGVLAGSRVIIAHRNVMSSQFRLVKLNVTLDGAQIYARTDGADTGGALDKEDEIVVFDGNLVPGPHTVSVELIYRGHGVGVFNYLNSYNFESRSSHTFTAPENGAVKLLSVGYERGNLTTEMKDRPSIDFQEIPIDASGKPLPRSVVRRKKASAEKSSRSKKSK